MNIVIVKFRRLKIAFLIAIMHALFAANLLRAAETNEISEIIPKSTFVIPTNAVDGRDPFYPNTTRSFTGGEIVEKTAPSTSAYTLELKGLSGVPGNRLAMVNAGGASSRTLAEGETAEVPTASGRVTVRCISIKDEAVIVEMNGRTLELRLRKK